MDALFILSVSSRSFALRFAILLPSLTAPLVHGYPGLDPGQQLILGDHNSASDQHCRKVFAVGQLVALAREMFSTAATWETDSMIGSSFTDVKLLFFISFAPYKFDVVFP